LSTHSGAWLEHKLQGTFCGLGSACVVTAFGSDDRFALYTSAGFVKGPKSAAARVNSYAGQLRTQAIAAGLPHSTKTFTSTYNAKKRQHKVVVTMLEVVASSSDGTRVMTRVTARDLVRKNNGTKGPFAKKVGIAAIDVTFAAPLPSGLVAKKAQRLTAQLRTLIGTGSAHRISGPVKLGVGHV